MLDEKDTHTSIKFNHLDIKSSHISSDSDDSFDVKRKGSPGADSPKIKSGKGSKRQSFQNKIRSFMKSSDKSITSPQLDKSNKSNQSKSGTRRNSKRGVEEEIFSSPNCMYCNGHFEALTPAEVLKKKYKIRKFLDGK